MAETEPLNSLSKLVAKFVWENGYMQTVSVLTNGAVDKHFKTKLINNFLGEVFNLS